jgi:hypothetical protein
MTRCAFATGSSTDRGNHAPEKCKQAIFEKYKQVIEQCEISHAHLCPLRSYVSEEMVKRHVDEKRQSYPPGCVK